MGLSTLWGEGNDGRDADREYIVSEGGRVMAQIADYARKVKWIKLKQIGRAFDHTLTRDRHPQRGRRDSL